MRTVQRIVEGHERHLRAATLLRLPPARRFHEHLAHGTRGDSAEVQTRLGSEPQRLGELQPGFVNERGGTERKPGIVA